MKYNNKTLHLPWCWKCFLSLQIVFHILVGLPTSVSDHGTWDCPTFCHCWRPPTLQTQHGTGECVMCFSTWHMRNTKSLCSQPGVSMGFIPCSVSRVRLCTQCFNTSPLIHCISTHMYEAPYLSVSHWNMWGSPLSEPCVHINCEGKQHICTQLLALSSVMTTQTQKLCFFQLSECLMILCPPSWFICVHFWEPCKFVSTAGNQTPFASTTALSLIWDPGIWLQLWLLSQRFNHIVNTRGDHSSNRISAVIVRWPAPLINQLRGMSSTALRHAVYSCKLSAPALMRASLSLGQTTHALFEWHRTWLIALRHCCNQCTHM